MRNLVPSVNRELGADPKTTSQCSIAEHATTTSSAQHRATLVPVVPLASSATLEDAPLLPAQMNVTGRLLVIDDNAAVLAALHMLFDMQGYQVWTAQDAASALTLLSQQPIDLVLQDMNFAKGEMSGAQGKQLFYHIRQHFPQLPIILMTAWTALDMVVELVKAGAVDYIAKPWDDARLLLTVQNTLRLQQVAQQLQQVQAQQQRQQQERWQRFAGADLCGLVFASTAMEQVLQFALQLAPATAAVLITGENGTGKEGIAHILHANSPRRHQPFVAVNMGALPVDLMEAELFGAEAGAYSGLHKTRIGRFEAADGGTLFLDEIGNLSLSGQMKLLRVLQTGEFERLGSSVRRKVDVRVLSATNADLTQAIAQGAFRQDLYYRLNVIELHIPPLRRRSDDIVPLARHFWGAATAVDAAVWPVLQQYAWPGNVRELQNVCQRAQLLSQGELIDVVHLQLPVTDKPTRSLEDIDAATLTQALADAGGVVSRAAKALGITRQALYRRLEFYGLRHD
jgi:DNA-binding NtrC family response regulator